MGTGGGREGGTGEGRSHVRSCGAVALRKRAVLSGGGPLCKPPISWVTCNPQENTRLLLEI